MTQAAFGLTPFSASVDLWLECEYGRFPLGQVGPDFIIMSQPTTLPPCEARVMVDVGGHVYGSRVWVPRGVTVTDVKVEVIDMDAAAPF